MKTDIYKERVKALVKRVETGYILLLGNREEPYNYKANTYHFRQDSTFLYFSGINLPNMAMVINAKDASVTLYGNELTIDDIIWEGVKPTIKEMAEDIGVTNTKSLDSLNDDIRTILTSGDDIHYLPPYRASTKADLETLLTFKDFKLEPSKKLITTIIDLRSYKSQSEIELIDKACDVGYDMHTSVMQALLQSKTEQELVAILEYMACCKGATTSFPSILSQRGAVLHNHDHSGILSPGKMLLVDAGAEIIEGYASDFTRTMPVNGVFSAKQRAIYEIVLAAKKKAHSLIKVGVTYQHIHLEASKEITRGLVDLGLLRGNVDTIVEEAAHAMFFPHGLGHMMGLDVHDMENLGQPLVGYDSKVKPIDKFGTAYLRLGRELQEGFVLTVEPGIYFIPELITKWQKEKKFTEFINYEKALEYLDFGGIRLEDDVLVTATGSRLLGSKQIPIEIDDVEKMIKG